MSSDTLQSAIISIRSGDKETGKLLLAEVIRNDPRNETTRLGLMAVCDGQSPEPPRLEKPSEPTTPPSIPASIVSLLQIKRLDQVATLRHHLRSRFNEHRGS